MMIIFATILVFPLLVWGSEQEQTDLSNILSEAQAVPNVENGQVTGYTVINTKSGSKFEKLGFKKGDVIKTVNGEQVDSPSKAMELYNNLRADGDNAVDIERAVDHQE